MTRNNVGRKQKQTSFPANANMVQSVTESYLVKVDTCIHQLLNATLGVPYLHFFQSALSLERSGRARMTPASDIDIVIPWSSHRTLCKGLEKLVKSTKHKTGRPSVLRLASTPSCGKRRVEVAHHGTCKHILALNDEEWDSFRRRSWPERMDYDKAPVLTNSPLQTIGVLGGVGLDQSVDVYMLNDSPDYPSFAAIHRVSRWEWANGTRAGRSDDLFYDRKAFFPPKWVNVNGHSFPVPADPQRALAQHYGPLWPIPVNY